jgi:hypothetical protein
VFSHNCHYRKHSVFYGFNGRCLVNGFSTKQIPQLPCSTAPVLTGWWLTGPSLATTVSSRSTIPAEWKCHNMKLYPIIYRCVGFGAHDRLSSRDRRKVTLAISITNTRTEKKNTWWAKQTSLVIQWFIRKDKMWRVHITSRGGALMVGEVHVPSPPAITKVMIAWNCTSMPLRTFTEWLQAYQLSTCP